MERLSPEQKRRVAARIDSFPVSGLTTRLSGTITKHHKSAHGRDFKLLAQVALFVIWDHLEDLEQSMWLSLCKVRVIKHDRQPQSPLIYTCRSFNQHTVKISIQMISQK